MRIVILSDFFGPGGAEGIAIMLAKNLKELGHDVSVITTIQEEHSEDKSNLDGIDIYRIYSKYNLFWRPYVSLYNRQTFGSIKEILNNLKPDIVHAHVIHIYLSYAVLRIAKELGAKVFLTAHDVMLFHYGKLVEFNYKVSVWQQIKRAGKTYNPFRNLVIKYYLKYVDKIFTVSDALKEALAQNGITNITAIHNGIDVSAWGINDTAIKTFKEKHNIQGKKVVLFGGRLGWLKGGREICLAMKSVIEAVPSATLLLAGKIDKEVEAVLNFAAELGIEENIIAAGWLSGDELKAAYYAADIVTVPSICFDSFPTVNLEAMACKKPVVATCFGGSREAVLDGETGYIVNPFNIEMMAGKIVYLLSNPNIAKKMGEAGYERVKKEFNLGKMVNNYLAWYSKSTKISN